MSFGKPIPADVSWPFGVTFISSLPVTLTFNLNLGPEPTTTPPVNNDPPKSNLPPWSKNPPEQQPPPLNNNPPPNNTPLNNKPPTPLMGVSVRCHIKSHHETSKWITFGFLGLFAAMKKKSRPPSRARFSFYTGGMRTQKMHLKFEVKRQTSIHAIQKFCQKPATQIASHWCLLSNRQAFSKKSSRSWSLSKGVGHATPSVNSVFPMLDFKIEHLKILRVAKPHHPKGYQIKGPDNPTCKIFSHLYHVAQRQDRPKIEPGVWCWVCDVEWAILSVWCWMWLAINSKELMLGVCVMLCDIEGEMLSMWCWVCDVGYDIEGEMLRVWCWVCDVDCAMLGAWCWACEVECVMLGVWCWECDAQRHAKESRARRRQPRQEEQQSLL